MIQNNLLSSQTKFDQNQIKNTELKKICYWSLNVMHDLIGSEIMKNIFGVCLPEVLSCPNKANKANDASPCLMEWLYDARVIYEMLFLTSFSF